ncbi:MAG: tRNA preQ1(34) S-adenosylmethionine ribosyltransferase-isomerase QueA [Acidobacteria bacterium]|nr:tRNA preQ1(34) S-adenosylmethionine ribosyltransferase-isomerase QueA [Acidobacteriota bacterium]MDA1234964.1 tRNA preQ1(34) S-adenosylmethionine ribosyltransferase-isomerase QueA [Acidobacteriota bacterium]
MDVADFSFELPEELIAQAPPTERDGARMLVVDRQAGVWQDRAFRDFPSYVLPADRLVVNNTRVIPARLFGRRADVPGALQQPTGVVEVLLSKPLSATPPRWEALVRPSKKLDVGQLIVFPEGLEARVTAKGEYGLRTLEFNDAAGFYEKIERIGHMPLPPYIRREDTASDRQRYQTVYASTPGAAAAPTAGLHFTEQVLASCRERGAEVVEVTLHVGLGTFQPVRVQQLSEHRMHSERFELSAAAAETLGPPGGRIIAAGTTAVRTLETAAQRHDGAVRACSGETDIFIYPGYRFQVVQALLTNFHLPESTLLMLVCAFAGTELMLDAYRHAVKERYRFFSYGDCMLII